MRKGTCKHFNGHHRNKTCDAGVEYKSVLTEPDRIDGSAFRYPCVSDWSWVTHPLSEDQLSEFKKRGHCDKFAEPGDQEIADYQNVINDRRRKMELTLPMIAEIKREHKGEGWKGIVVCPVCGGKLHLSHSAHNNHVWGKCETENCVSWME